MRITMTDWIHRVLDEYIKEGDCCIDATMGKGGDTYYLCSKTGESGKVYAFDVQADALRQTREKLDKHKMNAELILDGHEHMKEYVKEMTVSCIMFNLGYLPGGDHHLHHWLRQHQLRPLAGVLPDSAGAADVRGRLRRVHRRRPQVLQSAGAPQMRAPGGPAGGPPPVGERGQAGRQGGG